MENLLYSLILILLSSYDQFPTDSRHSLDSDAETKSPLICSGSPTDCYIILCKHVPANLNRKDIIEKHFGRFGKVRKVFCRPAKNMATVHFNDHVS